jgi:hypothetical protein
VYKEEFTMKRLSIPHVPELGSLTIDAVHTVLEEQGARIPIETINWPDLFGYRPLTTVSIARTDDRLFVLFQVHGNCLRAVNTKDNQPVHEDSCVEFFVKQVDSEDYFNFEFNCIGTCKAARHHKDRANAVTFTPDQLATIERWSSLGQRAFNELSGLFNWDVCVSIPFTLIDVQPDQLPPVLLGNFYKCADATEQPHYVSWNPIRTERPDFHRPEFFGELRLA